MSSERPIRWGAEALWHAMSPLLPGIAVEVVESIPSTNAALIERARRRAAERPLEAVGGAIVRRSVESRAFGRRSDDLLPTLLVAEHQSAGRGRHGRAWRSEPGASLTFSLAVATSRADLSGLSLAIGAALADALDPARAPEPSRLALKWPNDLWLRDADVPQRGRKLGGVLIEAVPAGDARLVVVGVGLNVAPLGVEARAALSQGERATGFASLQELDAGCTAPQVLARVALPLAAALRRFEAEGFGPFAAAFAARDLLWQQEVATTQSDAVQGVAEGVTADGALRVRTAEGLREIRSGEVSVRLNSAAGALS